MSLVLLVHKEPIACTALVFVPNIGKNPAKIVNYFGIDESRSSQTVID
jgi:hypothetical protein